MARQDRPRPRLSFLSYGAGSSPGPGAAPLLLILPLLACTLLPPAEAAAPPTCQIQAPDHVYEDVRATFTATCSSDNALKWVRWYVDGDYVETDDAGGRKSFTATYERTFITDGPRTLSVVAEDVDGVEGPEASVRVDVEETPQANLVVTGITRDPPDAKENDNFALVCAYRNAGAGPTRRSFSVKMTIEEQGKTTTGVPALAPGQEASTRFNFYRLFRGSYPATCTLDTADVVDETFESDNAMTRTFTFLGIGFRDAPHVVLAEPASGSFDLRTPAFRASVLCGIGPDGVTHVEFTRDGARAALVPVEERRATHDFAFSAEGTYVLGARCLDAAGRTNASKDPRWDVRVLTPAPDPPKPATLRLALAPAPARPGEPVRAVATLQDAAGAPIVGRVLAFRLEPGDQLLGSNLTGADGVTALVFRAPVEGAWAVRASFAGDSEHAANQARADLRVATPPTPATPATTPPGATPPAGTTPVATTPRETGPAVVISDLDAPAQASVGQSILVRGTLRNEGSGSTSASVLLLVNGAVRDSAQIVLAPGATETVAFDFTPSVAGAFDVTLRIAGQPALPPKRVQVSIHDSTPATTTPVTTPPTTSTPAATSPATPTASPPSPTLPTAPPPAVPAPGLAALAAALGAAALALRRRG